MVIDLTDNYSFIKELENNLRDRIKEVREKGIGRKREIKLSDATFDIEIENHDLYEMLMSLRNRLQLSWMDNYELAKKYYEHHGDLSIPYNYLTMNGYEYDKGGTALGVWIANQRRIYESLSVERRKMLEEIDFVQHFRDSNWMQIYNLAEKYYEHYGNLLIPQNFKTTNGYEFDESGVKLGKWLCTQRKYFDGMTSERKELLEKIDFTMNTFETKWQNMYELAKKYYKHYGNSVIPYKFITINGYEYNEDGVRLGKWLYSQRKYYDNFSDDRKKLLDNIGLSLDINIIWQKVYELAKNYYEHYGNLLIPWKFKTTNGYEYDEKGVKLGVWINTQRKKYDDLSVEKKKKLEEISFVQNAHEIKWLEMYSLAKKYYDHYGNLLISHLFKTTNGYEFDEAGEKLGSWLRSQKYSYDSLSDEQKKMLEKIGFVKSLNDSKWQKMYELAKAYFIHYNNLYIDRNFKTINGYEFKETGERLGCWIANQRNLIEHGSERERLLTNIGMIWSVRSNLKEVMEMCNRYNIDYNKNKLVLKSISVEVLQSKIKFLLANNMSIVNSDGKLDKIFSISYADMKERFGVTLEELINEYYKDKERGM